MPAKDFLLPPEVNLLLPDGILACGVLGIPEWILVDDLGGTDPCLGMLELLFHC